MGSDAVTPADLASGTWRLDPAQASIEFHVPHFYGLMTIKGRFGSSSGHLDLSATPALELTIDADSLDTGNARRDKHLRSDDFFDTASHPQVRFVSDTATLQDSVLHADGRLLAGGGEVPLSVDARVTAVGDGLEIEAAAAVDQRQLGMTWSPMGIVRAPSRLFVRGRLVRD